MNITEKPHLKYAPFKLRLLKVFLCVCLSPFYVSNMLYSLENSPPCLFPSFSTHFHHFLLWAVGQVAIWSLPHLSVEAGPQSATWGPHWTMLATFFWSACLLQDPWAPPLLPRVSLPPSPSLGCWGTQASCRFLATPHVRSGQPQALRSFREPQIWDLNFPWALQTQ